MASPASHATRDASSRAADTGTRGAPMQDYLQRLREMEKEAASDVYRSIRLHEKIRAELRWVEAVVMSGDEDVPANIEAARRRALMWNVLSPLSIGTAAVTAWRWLATKGTAVQAALASASVLTVTAAVIAIPQIGNTPAQSDSTPQRPPVVAPTAALSPRPSPTDTRRSTPPSLPVSSVPTTDRPARHLPVKTRPPVKDHPTHPKKPGKRNGNGNGNGTPPGQRKKSCLVNIRNLLDLLCRPSR